MLLLCLTEKKNDEQLTGSLSQEDRKKIASSPRDKFSCVHAQQRVLSGSSKLTKETFLVSLLNL